MANRSRAVREKRIPNVQTGNTVNGRCISNAKWLGSTFSDLLLADTGGHQTGKSGVVRPEFISRSAAAIKGIPRCVLSARNSLRDRLRLQRTLPPVSYTHLDVYKRQSSSYTTSNATLIRFTDAAAKASGKYTGYEIDGTDVSITAAGTYVFSGDCDNGSITVKKGVTGVTIVLNGLTLTNDDSAAITLNKTAEASLIAAAGTTNTVADTEGSSDENAAVKVKSGAALAIGGTGTLTVDGNAKNGIQGAADAVITVAEVKLNINAVNDGLSCDDELNITGGTLRITCLLYTSRCV